MAEVSWQCTMQEGVIDEPTRERLAAALRQISQEHLDADPDAVPVSFSDIPHGYGFRGGELSTTSLVRGSVVGGIEQPRRVELLQAVCDRWKEISGCTTDELVATARDA